MALRVTSGFNPSPATIAEHPDSGGVLLYNDVANDAARAAEATEREARRLWRANKPLAFAPARNHRAAPIQLLTKGDLSCLDVLQFAAVAI